MSTIASVVDTDTDEQLVQYYLDWTEDAIQELAGHIDKARSAPEPDVLQAIYEISHNIKGMGTSFGFPLMTEAGRSLCGYLRARGQGARPSGSRCTRQVIPVDPK